MHRTKSQLVDEINELQRQLAALRSEFDQLSDRRDLAADEAARESEDNFRILQERLDLAFRATNSAIWDWDLEKKLAWSSRGNQLLLRRGSEERTELFHAGDDDNAWASNLHPDDRGSVLQALHDHWDKGSRYDVEYRYRQPGGQYIWIHSIGETVRGPDRKPLRMVGSNSDITGRIEAETARDEAELRLSSILENAPVSIVSKDVSGRYLYANPKWLDLYGLEANQVHGKTVYDVAPKYADLISARDREVIENRSVIEFEYVEDQADGERSFLVKKFPILDSEGRVASIISMEIDITERKRAEDTLRANEKRLQLMADSLPALIAYVDSDLRYHFVNRTFEEWTATRESDVIGRAMEDVLGSETYAELSDFAARAIQGEHVKYERTMPYAGATRTVQAEMVPDIGENGRVRGYYGLASDITERKTAEDALRLTQFSLDHAGDAVFWIGESGRLEYVNRSCEQMLGYSRDALTALHIWELDPHVDRDDWPRIWADISHRDSHTFESVYLTRKGGEVPVEVTTNQISFGDRQIVCSYSRDITERERNLAALRESENKLVESQKIGRVGSWHWNMNNNEVYWSEGLKHLFGLAPQDSIEGYEGFLKFLHPDDVRRVDEKITESISTGLPFDENYRVIGADGVERSIHGRGEIFADDSGKVIRMAGTASDVTAQKEADERLRQAQKMEAVGQLTGGIAHDFNNLLAVMMGNLELIRDSMNADDRIGEMIARGVKAAERGASLTDRLLAFSRKQTLLPTHLDLNKLVAGMAELLRRTLGESIEVRTNGAQDLWLCYVDQAQLENALLNLSINARDAMPEGGRLIIETANKPINEVVAAAQSEVEPGDYVMLRVSDSGIGIAEETLEHVFEPFFTTKEIGKGTGLGLSMVHGFAKQSGGNVTITSGPGEGTRVELYLPRSVAHDEETIAARPPRNIPSGEGERVLIVEDDADVRALAVDLLLGLGYEPVEADTAQAALEAIERTASINLLLSDVVLPGAMNGPDLAAEIRRRSPATKIVYMTGYAEQAFNNRGASDEPAHIIQKPFSKMDLARAIRSVMEDGGTRA